jgi:hypothetical protein
MAEGGGYFGPRCPSRSIVDRDREPWNCPSWSPLGAPVENAQVQELRSNYVNLQAQYAATEKELEELREAQKELQIRIDSQHQKKGTESIK